MNKKAKNKSFSHYSFFPKNRKGTHVEVIISFIIFIVFVVFILIASKPAITKQEDKKNLFDNLELQLIEKTSADMKTITITLQPSAVYCLNVDNFENNYNTGNGIIVKDSSGNILDAYIDGGGSLTINRLSDTDTFFKIYSSEEFAPTSGSSCPSVAIQGVGITKTEKYVFQQIFSDLVANGDYEDLREEFNVDDDMDFTYGLVLSDGSVIEKTHEDLTSDISTSIYVEDTQIEYIDLDGSIKIGYLRTKIW